MLAPQPTFLFEVERCGMEAVCDSTPIIRRLAVVDANIVSSATTIC